MRWDGARTGVHLARHDQSEGGTNLKLRLSARLAVLALIVALTALGVSSSTPGANRAASADPLRVAISVAPPWLYINTHAKTPATRYYGPAIDLSYMIGKALKRPVQFIEVNQFGTLVAGLLANQYDIIAAPLFATPARKQVVDFILWSKGGNCYAALKTNSKVNTEADFNSPDVTIAVDIGSKVDQLFPTKYPKAHLLRVIEPAGSVVDAVDVIAGRADITHFDAALVYQLQAAYPQLKFIPPPAQCIKNPDFVTDIGVAIRKDASADFRATLQQVVTKNQKKLDASLKKYSKLLLPRGH
jgi:polar amino acid transport system substrate-binding protein